MLFPSPKQHYRSTEKELKALASTTKTRSTGTVHTSAKARFTSVAIRIATKMQSFHLFNDPLPTFLENFMQIRLGVFFAQIC